MLRLLGLLATKFWTRDSSFVVGFDFSLARMRSFFVLGVVLIRRFGSDLSAFFDMLHTQPLMFMGTYC